jgi:hypothetical protein
MVIEIVKAINDSFIERKRLKELARKRETYKNYH